MANLGSVCPSLSPSLERSFMKICEEHFHISSTRYPSGNLVGNIMSYDCHIISSIPAMSDPECHALAADSGCDFHRYADVAFDGVFGTVRPSGLGGA